MKALFLHLLSGLGEEVEGEPGEERSLPTPAWVSSRIPAKTPGPTARHLGHVAWDRLRGAPFPAFSASTGLIFPDREAPGLGILSRAEGKVDSRRARPTHPTRRAQEPVRGTQSHRRILITPPPPSLRSPLALRPSAASPPGVGWLASSPLRATRLQSPALTCPARQARRTQQQNP